MTAHDTALPVSELRRISAHMGATSALLGAYRFLVENEQREAATLLIRNVNTLQQRAVADVAERTPT